MFSVDFSVVQSLLSFISVQGHLPVDLHRRRIVLDTIQGKPACAVIEGRRNRAQQPVLQNPDTANTALVEIQPVIRDPALRQTCKWHTPQEFEQGGLERNAIHFSFQLLAARMDPNQLPPFASGWRRRRQAKRNTESDAGEASTEESLPREKQA